jgi:hypothetical protein
MCFFQPPSRLKLVFLISQHQIVIHELITMVNLITINLNHSMNHYNLMKHCQKIYFILVYL